MTRKKLVLCLGILVIRLCACAQGTFQNLDFEQAKIIINPDGFISTSNAFPGWAVFGVGGVPLNEVERDGVLSLGAGIDDGGDEIPPLDGKFSAMLAGSGTGGVGASIAQSGLIPSGAKSLTFLAVEPFLVFFAGHSLPLQNIASGPGNLGEVYAADISGYAGQYGQLVFQAGLGGTRYLDDISFFSRRRDV